MHPARYDGQILGRVSVLRQNILHITDRDLLNAVRYHTTARAGMSLLEKVVFIDKYATLCELYDAINNNFEGYDELRKKLLSVVKYGNNDDFVDKYAVWFVDFLANEFSKYKLEPKAPCWDRGGAG